MSFSSVSIIKLLPQHASTAFHYSCPFVDDPFFSFSHSVFRAIFHRSPEFAMKEVKGGSEKSSEELVEGLAESQKAIWALVIREPRISKKAMAEAIGISTTAIDKNLTTLKQKGTLRRVGPAKGGHWEVVQ